MQFTHSFVRIAPYGMQITFTSWSAALSLHSSFMSRHLDVSFKNKKRSRRADAIKSDIAGVSYSRGVKTKLLIYTMYTLLFNSFISLRFLKLADEKPLKSSGSLNAFRRRLRAHADYVESAGQEWLWYAAGFLT